MLFQLNVGHKDATVS